LSSKIRRGDALTVLPTLPADTVDCVIADPPYNSGGARPVQVSGCAMGN
jgi:site-specific DNA-methyltransferase (adenine-specific)